MATAKRWTDEELQIMRDMAASGRSQLEVAAKLGRSKKSIERKATTEKVRFKNPYVWTKEDERELVRLHDLGIDMKAISERLGYSVGGCFAKMTQIKKRRPGRKKKGRRDRITFTAAELDDMAEMFKTNVAIEEIAKEFGCSPPIVKKHMKKRGLKMRSETGEKATRKDKVLLPFGQLVRYYLDLGMSQQEIADRFGCNRHRVQSSLKHYGIEMKPRHERKKGKGSASNGNGTQKDKTVTS
jgi:DNA-binding CsgD family transcriptional regulator